MVVVVSKKAKKKKNNCVLFVRSNCVMTKYKYTLLFNNSIFLTSFSSKRIINNIFFSFLTVSSSLYILSSIVIKHPHFFVPENHLWSHAETDWWRMECALLDNGIVRKNKSVSSRENHRSRTVQPKKTKERQEKKNVLSTSPNPSRSSKSE